MEGKLVEWPVIGIDLGTTYSCVGVWQHDHVDIITNDQGNRTTPSWVAFTELERLVGDAAKNQISANPTNTIYDVKRLIGRRITDEIVQNDMKLWPFSVRPGTDDIPMIEVSYKGEVKQFAPEQISAMVLTKMKETAEAYLGSEVKNAVVTVPAYFSDCQRQATKDAGVIAGLNVVSMINEPTAAAIAYGIHKTAGDCYVNTRNVLVFDLGGGTFDVSVVSVDDDSFQVNSISGDTHLGGADFDNKLVNHFVAEFRRKHKKDIGSNPRALARLRASSERAKRSLSSATESSFELDCLFEEIDFSCTISRARFEMLNAELFLSCMKPVENCLLDAKMDKSDIDDVILVGGSTRIPKVQELLQKFFSGNELCKRLNPDEAVAYGAAIHAAILSGVLDKQQFLLVEVTPLSLGIGVRNIDFAVVMPKNTSIPRKIEQGFTTVYDNQTEVAINVYEGERPIAKDNNFLGKFCLYDIPSAPKNVPDIMVSFSIDGNGILTVTAEEKSSGNKDQVTITKHTGRLSEGEIARMVKDAKEYQREDTELKKVEKSKELFEHYVNDRQDFLREHGWKMEAEDMEVIKVAVERAIQWLDKNSHIKDAAKFDRKLDKLRSICQPLMGKMYRKDN